MWTLVGFGEHAARTLPQIIFKDADWFFWGFENGVFSKNYRLAVEAETIHRRATSIVPPYDDQGRPLGVEYLVDRTSGRFAGLQFVPASIVGPGNRYSDRIDLSVPRQLNDYDKTGYNILMGDLKELLFGSRSARATRSRCEEFFDVEGNFLTP